MIEPATTDPREATSEPRPDLAPGPGIEPGFEPQQDPVREPPSEPDFEPGLEPTFEPPSDPGFEQTPGLSVEDSDTAPPSGMPDVAGESEARPRTVGRQIAEALRAVGVRYAFTVPGESFLGLLDGLDAVGIRVIATRHEGAAAFMAEAHGQLTGRPAVCIGTRAVGAANLAIGIHTALADSTPMFAFVGGVERAHRGREAFQEVDVPATIGGLAKWSAEIAAVADVPAIMEEAISQALSERPGPVRVSIPEDVLDELAPAESTIGPYRPAARRPTDDEVRAVLQLLASATRPIILAGAGVLRARTSNDLVRFAELLRVPIIASWRRGDIVPNDNPLYLGMAGYGAPSIVRERLLGADAMLVLGSRLNEVTTSSWEIPGPDTRWAHVDAIPTRPDPALREADIAIEADARNFLRAAVSRLEKGVLHAELADIRRDANDEDRVAWEAATVVDSHPWEGPGVHPGRTIATLRRVLPDDGVVTTDAGNFAGWAARGFRFRRPGTFLGPTSGAMGYGLPAAIAAALVHRDRPVVALVGDGGLGMTMAEIETAVREGVRVVVLVFDNQRYGMIRVHQDQREAVAVATELGPIDFAAVARACGARGVRVDDDAAFEPALRQALAGTGPTVIHLPIDRRWESVDRLPS